MKYLLSLFILIFIFGCNGPEEKVVYKNSQILGTSAAKDTPVTEEFGSLTVKTGEATGGTKIVPWSSWWFPTKDRYMFENATHGALAPLQKYDLYTKRRDGVDPESAWYEENEIYDPSEVNWAGLCHAWAVASVLHTEPKNSIVRKDITFSVADQKALLLKSYENVGELKIYGKRYNGNYSDDYNDIYPDQFHRFAQVFLFEKHLPFLIDYDPSFPVWTVPVYNIKFIIERENESTAHVKTWITFASSFVDSPQFVGTKKMVKFYEYKLYGNWDGDNLNVTGSEWVNDSVYDHPDYLIAFPDSVKRGVLNKKLDLEIIDEIVGKNYVANQ
ncbi:MAG: hypothetical protein ACOYL6_16320 [Bacteriovoracaceae bacterium]